MAARRPLVTINGELQELPTADTVLGAAPGATAYDVAVANGFVGDEAAWLASLQGANGAAGTIVAVGTTAPASPAVGDLWVDTN